MQPFHLAFVVDDLDATRRFYVDVLECRQGRSASSWIDFDLFGHQIVAHLRPGAQPTTISNPVDAHDVPVPHFGVVLTWARFERFAEQLRSRGIKFEIAPTVRFQGEVGEQITMFFRDPSGNALEFKAFRNPEQLFEV